MVSCLTFRSLIHFEFIFECVVRKWSSLIVLHVAGSCPVFPAPFAEETFFFFPFDVLSCFVED